MMLEVRRKEGDYKESNSQNIHCHCGWLLGGICLIIRGIAPRRCLHSWEFPLHSASGSNYPKIKMQHAYRASVNTHLEHYWT